MRKIKEGSEKAEKMKRKTRKEDKKEKNRHEELNRGDKIQT